MDTKGFAERLKYSRIKAGITQGELAEAAGVSTKVIGLWETGGGIPKGNNLDSIARVLGVGMSWLLQGGGRADRSIPPWVDQMLEMIDRIPDLNGILMFEFGRIIDEARKRFPNEMMFLADTAQRRASHVEPVVISGDPERESPGEPLAK